MALFSLTLFCDSLVKLRMKEMITRMALTEVKNPDQLYKEFKINTHKLIYFSPYDRCPSVFVCGIISWIIRLENLDMQYCVSKGLYEEKWKKMIWNIFWVTKNHMEYTAAPMTSARRIFIASRYYSKENFRTIIVIDQHSTQLKMIFVQI